jgi:tetratricopeptide (TPR) repeat protein
MKINGELKRANTKIHQRDLEGALHDYDQCINSYTNACSPRVHRGMVRSPSLPSNALSFSLSLSLQLKTLLESYSEAHDDFAEALQISPTNLRAKYQKLINDAKIGAKENRPERVEQALSSFEEYYDTCKQDIYYALALTSVSLPVAGARQ